MSELERKQSFIPGELKKGWFSQLKDKFRRHPANLSDLPSQRESAAEILSRITLPDREVTLDDISVYSLPINWYATKSLAAAINELKETPIDRFEIARLKPVEAVYEGIPWIASAIVHHYNSEIPIILPNEDDVVAMKPWLRDISHLLGRFSERWQYRFGRFIEGKAEKTLQEAAGNILRRMDTVGEIENPRARFVPELEELYRKVTKPKYERVENDFTDIFAIFSDDPAPKRRLVPIERKVEDLVAALRWARNKSPYGWINRTTYPLTSRVLELSHFPSDDLENWQVAVAGSELMHGIHKYLIREKVKNLSSPPAHVRTFDVFDPDTWGGENIMRSLGETFKWDQIEATKRELPYILTEIRNILPEDGHAVVESVRVLAENILILSKQGVSNAEIAVALFKRSTSVGRS